MHYTLDNKNPDASVELVSVYPAEDIELVNVKVVFPKAVVPERIVIKFEIPAVDAYSVFSPSNRGMRNLGPSWSRKKTQSRLASSMPLHSIVSLEGMNRATVALSDALIPTEIATGVHEENAFIKFDVTLFTMPTTPITEYSVTMRVDTRNVKFYDSVYDASRWWEEECGYTPAYVPESARGVVNSIWYSFHQNIDVDEVVRQCELSKPLGMETVIVDDGWQTDDSNRGYAYCGDWKVAAAKVPDMKSFVDRVHAAGMKFVLWYSVPFIGVYSEAYEKFKTMLLRTETDKKWYPIDPRYKEARDYIVGIYKKAAVEWGLDGFKLDFIDSFSLGANDITPDSRRDCESLEDAVDMLMTEVYSSLRDINPEIMIEFRQSYVGPSIRKYGNMLRVHDCPNDPICNRVEIVNLRLTSGSTPVHSDMLMWNSSDTAESAAVQLASVLYSVPQISVLIDKLPESHLKMLTYYLAFWNENKKLLLEGRVTASNPESNYSTVRATLGDKEIITLYVSMVVESSAKEFVAVNASSEQFVYLKNVCGASYSIVNCLGELTDEGTVLSALEEKKVPIGGMIFVKN